jgi:hypothetical protein
MTRLKTAPDSHTGQVLSRSVTFVFALDPNFEQRILLAKCAGARRFTVNHHLARVKANLETRSSERVTEGEGDALVEPTTPALSWSRFSFINEFNDWKNGQSEDSPLNEDGSRGLSWRHDLPCDVFECASVDAARPRTFRKFKEWPAKWPARRIPSLSGQGKSNAELSPEKLRDSGTSAIKPIDPIRRLIAPATT